MNPERWRRIKEMSQSVWDRTPAERDAFLESETAGDPELRREVERILRYATGSGYLDKPAWVVLPIECELEAGARLGPYEILNEVGAGGMGRVYKARDTRLGRIVAIKVLSAEFSHRLQIEGRAISALNHPHVCALYDIGDQDGTAYLVMEYVEGETLAAVLARGPQPIEMVLRYGAEIAGALAAAHDRGIVHRDLKPANVMVTTSGVKVLDFGVASMADDEASDSGGVAGTAAYMSPSQLNGNPAHERSDIFALGLVLWEMATGTRHTAGSAEELRTIPAPLASLIERCMQEDAGRRFQRMDEVRAALERLRTESVGRAGRRRMSPAWTAAALAMATAGGVALWQAGSGNPRPASKASPAVDTGTNAVVVESAPRRAVQQADSKAAPATPERAAAPAIAERAVSPDPPKEAAPPLLTVARHVPLDPPSLGMLATYSGLKRDPSFSPDGTKVAFAWQRERGHGFGIYVRPVKEDDDPVNLTSAEFEDWGPAWSPDGRKIAFRRKGGGASGIYWVSASRGPENFLTAIGWQDAETLPQMSWSRDGKWIAAPDRDLTGSTHIYLISAASGEKRALTSNSRGTDHAPAFSPDGRVLAYNSCRNGVDVCDIYAIDLGRDLQVTQKRRITDEGIYVRGVAWAPDGRSLIYSAGPVRSQGTFLWRVTTDPPGLPERIDLAGSRAAHPAIAGGFLAYTRMDNWNLMMIRNFR